MDLCNCVEPQWSPDDILLKYQYIADFFIALAYFSIPLELVYFVKKSAVFPYKWVLTQFGAFIVLCGATHFINLWTFTVHSRNVAVVMAVAKVLTALVSCATALMLVHIIPDLLTVKTRELFLKTKAAELDREMGLIRTQEQTGRHVRMLTQEIRSTLDRRTILNTTLIELGKTLALEECALYMPTCNGLELQLSHTLHQQYPGPLTLPIHNPTIKKIFSSQRAMIIHPDTIMMTTRPRNGRVPGDVVAAMRVPLLHYTNLRIADWPDPSKRPYALMVLMLPPASARRWHGHELELVEVVAEQVAVALSHAAILEESLRARNLLLEQNIALDVARREAETAISARNKFLAVMNHEIHTPVNAILTYASMLQATVLAPEQRSMQEMVVKSANLLSLLVHDVFDLSRLDDGSFKLDSNKFNLCNLFQEVMDLVKPIASLKKLSLHLDLAPDLPEFALGDDKRLMHITLNIIGNAVKYTREGSITIMACLERREYLRDSHCPDFHPVEDDKNFFLRVQVRDTGFGIDPSDMPMVFNKFKSSPSKKNNDGTGLGLAICKRFVNLMDGHVWIESEGLGRGSTVTFIVKLQVPPRCVEEMQQVLPAWTTLDQTHFSHVKALLIDHDMSNGLLIKDLLKHLAVDVTAVCSGYEGLQVLSQFGRMFKIVFVDICMLDVDGCSLGVHVKKMFATQAERPLIIALTENTHLATRVRCFSLCVDGILLKPVSLEKVKNLLFKLLNQGSRF